MSRKIDFNKNPISTPVYEFSIILQTYDDYYNRYCKDYYNEYCDDYYSDYYDDIQDKQCTLCKYENECGGRCELCLALYNKPYFENKIVKDDE